MEREVAIARFQAAIAMADTGVSMVRQRLRREDAAATEAQIDERLTRWLRNRPMDAPGRVHSIEAG